jgi:hypothetical protein
MSRSFIHLRRALFGTSCAIVFGFGASEVLASPAQAWVNRCGPDLEAYCDNEFCPWPGGECYLTTHGFECACY